MRKSEKYSEELFDRIDSLLPDGVRGRIKPQESSLPDEIDIRGLPSGQWVSRGVYRMERVLPYGRSYGNGKLENPDPVSSVLKNWGAGPASVYLDLETTGLSRGGGSYAFLVGLGFCDADAFRVVQLFLAGPGWERNWLAALEAELPERFGLVTYNGRSFDLPLLRTRYALAHAAPVWDRCPQMDLLLLARHFFRGRLESCSLSSVEPHILGLYRDSEDVPGRFIPAMYTRYLSTSDAAPLAGIFYHNTLDIVSLSALQIRIAELVLGHGKCGDDMIRCGDLWSMAGDSEKAAAAWKSALEFDDAETAARMRLAEMSWKKGNESAAKEHLSAAAIDADDPYDSLIKLAKLEEHGTNDLASALAHAEQALKSLAPNGAIASIGYKYDLRRAETRRRISRLKKKIERGNGK